eukprot:gene8680-2984_t
MAKDPAHYMASYAHWEGEFVARQVLRLDAGRGATFAKKRMGGAR